MEQFKIRGGKKLHGEIEVLGVKNGILPLIAASLLADRGQTVIRNVPNLNDVHVISNVLEGLGGKVGYDGASRTLCIDCTQISSLEAPYEWVSKMRASFLVIGPLVARFHEARVSLPGGCAIGERRVDMHIEALQHLGASVTQDSGFVVATTSGLRGTIYHFDFPTHTGTENIMMAAVLAKGTTTLVNAACEPEVVCLADFLNSMGARVYGAGTPTITIEGVSRLSAIEFTPIPSRIETAFFLAAAAITGGDVVVKNAVQQNLSIVISKMQQMGIEVTEVGDDALRARCNGRMRPVDITTWPFPGFPTDFQPQMMALLTIADGVGIVRETVFEKRLMHVDELNRMGADVKTRFDEAVVTGVPRLNGAPVIASDLQAGAGLVLAGLAAEGMTVVDRVYHIDRGYELLEERLTSLGADILRVNPTDT